MNIGFFMGNGKEQQPDKMYNDNTQYFGENI